MDQSPKHDGKPARALLALALLATGVTVYFLGAGRLQGKPGSAKRFTPPPAFDPAKVQRAPPVHLAADTLAAFVRWVAATPGAGVQEVRTAIAAARRDDAVAQALIADLFNLPVIDIGRHLLLLAIIGELGQPGFAEPLRKFIDLPPASIVDDAPNGACDAAISHIDTAALLQARAVEMLAWLRTSEALEAVLGLARYHASRAVRLAALDAYTYCHEDSPDATERARAAARRAEARLVGLPRYTRESNPLQFADSMASFYRQHPEELPPAPHSTRGSSRPIPPARSSE